MARTLSTLLMASVTSVPVAAAEAPAEGMPPPRSTYYVALYEAGPAWVQGEPPSAQPRLREHFAYMDELHRTGHLPFAGPLVGDVTKAELVGVLLVVDAKSLDEARRLVLADPGLKADIMRLKDLRQMLVYIGGLADAAPGKE
jgi:uncharacterized protein YciI